MPTLNKLEYLDETKKEIKNALNTNFNSGITDEDTFRSYVGKINNIYTNWTKVTGEGTEITLNNTKKGKMALTPKGNTEQNGTPTPDSPVPIQNVTGLQNIEVCGKNLFDKSTIIENKYIDASGNFINDNTNFIGDFISIDNTKSYYINASSGQAKRIAYYDNSKSFISRQLISAVDGLLTIPNNAKYVRLSCYNVNLDSLQLEQNNQATTYEPYKGNTYEVNLGKNLFDKDNANIVEGYINASSGSITAYSGRGVVWIQCQPNTTYTISKISSTRFAVSTYPVKPEIGVSSSSNNAIRNDTATNITITSGANDNYLGVWLYNAEEDTLTRQQIIDTLQIEKSPKATSYSPYFTPIELCKIGTYQDYIYKSNGNWYLHQEIGKVVFDGSERWQSEAAANGYYRYNVASYLNALSPNAMNNRFTERINQGHGEYEYCYVQNDVGSVHIQLLQNRISSSSVNDFKNWLSNNKVDLYYILATPTDTLITDTTLIEQLNSLSNATSYDDVTNISTEGNLAVVISVSALMKGGN